MASNLACIGLNVTNNAELDALLGHLLPRSMAVARAGDVEIRRWEDSSGARLILARKNGTIVDLLPSFAGRAGATFGPVTRANADVAFAEVLDEDGEQCTAMAVELEQRLLLPADGAPGGPASVVALGSSMTVHADEAAFGASPESLLGGEQGADEKPRRFAAESFFSYGTFGDLADAEAAAWIAGTVINADRRTVGETAQAFIAARVRTVGFEADVCLAASEHPEPPAPGQILAGRAFLVASLPTLESAPTRRSWWKRR